MRLAAAQPTLRRHDLLRYLRLHARRPREVVNTKRVPLDRIVLFEATVSRLNQTLRVDLSIYRVLLASLQLRPMLVRRHHLILRRL